MMQMLVRVKCRFCYEEKTGAFTLYGPTCLDCMLIEYEDLSEEEQDNEELNERLGLMFGL